MLRLLSHPSVVLPVLLLGLLGSDASATCQEFDEGVRRRSFDGIWERIDRDYPYFDLMDVNWREVRDEHRPLALAAPTRGEFVHEIARMLSVLEDGHVSLLPPLDDWQEEGVSWSLPQLGMLGIGPRVYLTSWPEDAVPPAPARFQEDPQAFPEVVRLNGADPCFGLTNVLLAGRPGTTVEMELVWDDGTRSSHRILRPTSSPLWEAPQMSQEQWLQVDREGKLGFLGIRTFFPRRTFGQSFSDMLAAVDQALDSLLDTEQLLIDVRYNGGGEARLVAAILGRFLEQRVPIRLEGVPGTALVIQPRKDRYRGQVVVLANEFSGSGGEWFPAFLRYHGGAVVVGGPTLGAEAGIVPVRCADGSVVLVGVQSLADSQKLSFQTYGLEPDVYLPLEIEQLREEGLLTGLQNLERERLDAALEELGADDVSTPFRERVTATLNLEALVERLSVRTVRTRL